ncbi:MAG: hypothetical protein NTX86_05525 [Candidatus Dependentiae bacterium]|nr:hypothetical protein [Candidatus Dependentiae bacterium]
MALLKAGAGAIVARACYDLYDRAMHDPKEKKEKEEAERKEKEQHRELQERSLCIAESEAIQKGYILVLQVCNSGIPKEKCDELRNKHLTLLVLNTENKIRKEELQNNRLNSLEQTIQQPAQSLKEATQPKFLSAVSAAAKSVN